MTAYYNMFQKKQLVKMLEDKDAQIKSLKEQLAQSSSGKKTTNDTSKYFDEEFFDRALRVLAGVQPKGKPAVEFIDYLKTKSKRTVRDKLYGAIYEYISEETDTDDAEIDTQMMLNEIFDPAHCGEILIKYRDFSR